MPDRKARAWSTLLHGALGLEDGSGDEGASERAVRYSRERVRLWLASTAWNLGFGVAAVSSGAPARLYDAIERRVPTRLQTPAFVLAWSGLEWALGLPLAVYSGYVVERRYGLTKQSPAGWAADAVKGLAVATVLGTPTLTGFYWIVRRWPDRWWIVASVAALPFTVLAAGLYPVLIAPIFNRFEPIEDADLERCIRELAGREGVRVSRVMRMDMSRQTTKANAFFTGIGRTKRIVLGDTLLSSFTPEEVEVVVAHELAHQVHRDNWKLVGMAAVATFAGSYALDRAFSLATRLTSHRTGARELGDVRTLPLVSLISSAFSLAGLPAVNAVVRALERSADRYALRVTRNPRAFIGAMRQLQRTNLVDPDPPAAVRYLLHSHPTISERIRLAESYGK